MNQNQFLLYDHQKQVIVYPEKVSFYLQGEIIEAISENNDVYYLLFYKYHFLTAVKATSIRRHSFIESALTKGNVFKAPHPFINALLSTNPSCKIMNLKSLVKKLEKLYTPQEHALILTFFDSFFPKKLLFNEISSIFYEYRRNGQMFLGYRIIHILMGFAPKHSLVKQLGSDMTYNKYAVLYNEESEKLFAKDPLFAEKVLSSQIENNHCFFKLVALLEQESRWFDLIALYINKLILIPSVDFYSPLKTLLEQHLNGMETVHILEMLSSELPGFIPLQHDVFSFYIKDNKIDDVIKMMHKYDFKLSDSQVHTLGDILERLDMETHSLQPEVMQSFLGSVISFFPEKAEMLLENTVIALLKTHEINFINEWLQPFKDNFKSLPIFKKTDTIQQLSNDLDQMQTLGELYYEFSQFEKAIECFSWEMELKPTDPKPIQWIAKLYRERGMIYEADTYRQLCIDIQKQA